IVDSGAINHFCTNLDLFDTYEKYDITPSTITVANGKHVNIEHIGTVVFENGINLERVLHVPEFRYNLISTHGLCQDLECDIVFTHDKCLLQGSKINGSLLLGSLKSGLYAVDSKKSTGRSTHLVSEEDAKLWHLRYGHLPFNKLHLVCLITSVSNTLNCICQVCPKVKQVRFSFSISSSMSNKCFELLHLDIWGPYNILTYDGFNWFLTIGDDYSRHTWVFLMRDKSDAVGLFENFVCYVETQISTKVLGLRTGNAKEIYKGKLKFFYAQKGIQHQNSCVDTPQQYGVVERKHRHLLETVRALYFQYKVPLKFRGEYLLYAAHLINRIPLRCLNNFTPHEKLFGVKPRVDHLKVIGCLCYASTLKSHRTKFDPKASPCVFLGYPSGQKAYKIYNLETHKILVSRDVIFHEKHLPCQFQAKKITPHPVYLPTSTSFDPNLSLDIPGQSYSHHPLLLLHHPPLLLPFQILIHLQ
ncbi:Retrovirus-related Pol polyprotein from transposon TNT 1-94, partial [Bienertia sinuspersici]